MTPYEELDGRLRAFSTAPYLFMGAGMSRRYLGTDACVDLLRRMAQPTGRPYAYFASKADGQLPQVATEIAQAFHEVWWSASEFNDSRSAYGDQVRTLEGPLKVEIARHTIWQPWGTSPRAGALRRNLNS